MIKIKTFDEYNSISDDVKYHIDNCIPIIENIFRIDSVKFYNLFEEVRFLYDQGKIDLTENDKYLFDNTEIGKFAYYNNVKVPLDLPLENDMLLEAEYKGKEVKLNYPMRSSGPKKYKVYVRNPKNGNILKINFGDVNGGLTAKISDHEARKSFSARHKCELKKDKTKAGYWACRLNRYGHLFQGKTYPGYW